MGSPTMQKKLTDVGQREVVSRRGQVYGIGGTLAGPDSDCQLRRKNEVGTGMEIVGSERVFYIARPDRVGAKKRGRRNETRRA